MARRVTMAITATMVRRDTAATATATAMATGATTDRYSAEAFRQKGPAGPFSFALADDDRSRGNRFPDYFPILIAVKIFERTAQSITSIDMRVFPKLEP
ncbi:hypothetical protein Tamer19_03150 [Cupriavidus sp. TA19]|nr:hypothetical protein Tamer19_03150 [Cupriavidus sp. TA19]